MIEVSVHYPVGRVIGEPVSDKVRIEFILPKRPFLYWRGTKPELGLIFPRGYGVAWYDFNRDRVLMAPIPFNLGIGALVWLWYWFRYGAYWFSRHIPGSGKLN